MSDFPTTVEQSAQQSAVHNSQHSGSPETHSKLGSGDYARLVAYAGGRKAAYLTRDGDLRQIKPRLMGSRSHKLKKLFR